ncbi:L-seryl-tRNA(Sec) kinase [Elysia marginata]|uniref:L-seryl-tRNA(Sec) kinase n=1 Tax=Elysia marginata TaxID=1093978 RepID=A0AAV4H0W3_9GAST|nr:L-seryl-tRNA(Sec) kinase [Elysia marginata]
MYFRSMRYEFFKLARKYAVGFCQLYFMCSTTEAINENKKRTQEQQVPEVVIFRMAERLEPPDVESFAWEKRSAIIETRKSTSLQDHSIIQLIMLSLSNPVQAQSSRDEEEVSKSRVQGSSSLVHQGDLILRKCVAAWMAEILGFGQPALQSNTLKFLRERENAWGGHVYDLEGHVYDLEGHVCDLEESSCFNKKHNRCVKTIRLESS